MTRVVGPGSGALDGGGHRDVFVAPMAARGFAVAADPAARDRPAAGFVYGVDLRRSRSLVFVVDVGPTMCGVLGPQAAADPQSPAAHVAAALAGLPREGRVALVAGAGGFVSHFVPEEEPQSIAQDGVQGAAQRATRHEAASRWLAGLRCRPGRSLAPALRSAFERGPEMVVLLSGLDVESAAERERVRRESPADFATVADEQAELPAWQGVASVLVVSFARANPRGPQLAAATDGAYTVRPGALPGVAPGSPVASVLPAATAPGAIPRLSRAGAPVMIAPQAPPGCANAGFVRGAAGRAEGRAQEQTQAAFTAALPWDAALVDARNAAGARGAAVLVVEAREAVADDAPGHHASAAVVYARAFRCGPARLAR